MKYLKLIAGLTGWLYFSPYLAVNAQESYFVNTDFLEKNIKQEITQNIIEEENNILIQDIIVTGSSIFDDDILKEITTPLLGQKVPAEEIQTVANKITELYLEKGYFTSRAVLKQESLSTGNIEIIVIEGELEKIEIEGTKRINQNYIRNRIKLGTDKPLNSAKLEEQLRLLKINPLFENVEASLKSGTQVGQSILVVRVTEANPWDINVGIDNYSPPSIGSERITLGVGYQNVTGIGDKFAVNYNRTTAGGANNWDIVYSVPLNPKDGNLNLRAYFNNTEVITSGLRELDISGENELYELVYRQPLIRSTRQEFALSFGFTYQNGQTFTFAGPTPFGLGPNEDGVSKTSVFKFGQEYITRNELGVWSFRSLLNFGTGLFDATTNNGSIPDGLFFSWLGQIQRIQNINPDNFLIIEANLQLSTDGLLPSQQFVIGGGQSLRGYRQNVRAGDNGFKLSIEDRITLGRNEAGNSIFQLAPFLDMGAVWNVNDNPNPQQDETFLIGIGLGLLLQPLPDFNIRLDYGIPLVKIDDEGKNAQDEGFYFSVGYNF